MYGAPEPNRWSTTLAAGRSVLVDPAMLRVPPLQRGLTAFFFQFLLQAGLFFCVPLYLSVALGLSAIDTGIRIMPLSLGWASTVLPRT